MNNKDFNIIDDFYVTANSAESLTNLIDSYNEYENELAKLSRKKEPLNETSKLNFFKEIHANRKGERLYRKRNDANSALTVLWLSKVKELATLYSLYNNTKRFVGISKDELNTIAKLSHDVDNLQVLERFLAGKGIIFITEKSFAGSKLDGAVFLLESGQAVVALSLRYSRLDYFWFTLMHELAHLCLHSDLLQTAIVEDLDGTAESIVELEADKLALNSFIPRNIWRNCPPKYNLSDETVIDFAKGLKIHPAIVAGRLRKELDRYDKLSNIVNDVDIREYF
ncbi:ImmA/IrrE family metallo-endopeptidase [Pseudoalteromonas sp. Z9A5]|jgi:HTH-type transcriptional regulator/antitoxin HigA|uniref:ImmA/IrrE family metallo-endopeptidase n=1 Tax=Pseudoalteromonas sp. Z9A5 TaxID=2686355 RepID=UPI00140C1505|nr:ImmA/IrrE family metallo-endopeptidase [Pseudoalteromonas sp. Z9A5]